MRKLRGGCDCGRCRSCRNRACVWARRNRWIASVREFAAAQLSFPRRTLLAEAVYTAHELLSRSQRLRRRAEAAMMEFEEGAIQ